jgi:hypothetical protein
MIHFRPTRPEDFATIKQWVEADPGHADLDPLFWATNSPSTYCFAVGDDAGELMFVKGDAEGETLWLHIQFAPFDRKRIAAALHSGYPLLAAEAKTRGFRIVRFKSVSPALIRAVIGLGFRAELVAEL